jgi:four helix bundle protein
MEKFEKNTSGDDMNGISIHEYSKLTVELAHSIKEFSEKLPEDEVYNIKFLLYQCVSNIPERYENVERMEKSLDIIRSLIKLNSSLDECKDYLLMVQKLKFGNANDMVKKVDETSKTINSYFSNKINKKHIN